MSAEKDMSLRLWLQESLDGPPAEVAELGADIIKWLAGFRAEHGIEIYLPGEMHPLSKTPMKSYYVANSRSFIEFRPHLPGDYLTRTILGTAEYQEDKNRAEYVILNGRGEWNAFYKFQKPGGFERESGVYGAVQSFSELNDDKYARLLYTAVLGLYAEVEYATRLMQPYN